VQMTFGSGIHYCLGASLARAELQEALPVLAQRLPDLAADGEITWKPNTVGIWGPDDTTTGYDPVYMARIRAAAVSAITEAVKSLRPVKMSIGSILVEDSNHDLQPYVSDTRDPVVIDNRMHVMQFDGANDGKPVVTVLNWADHPESAGSENHYITADYTYWLRDRLEQHTGSPVVFVNGALGGQIGPGQVRPRSDDGTLLPQGERSFRFAEFWGLGLAEFAMKAFDQRTQVQSPLLAFHHTTFNAHIENSNYHTAFFLHLFNFWRIPARHLRWCSWWSVRKHSESRWPE